MTTKSKIIIKQKQQGATKAYDALEATLIEIARQNIEDAIRDNTMKEFLNQIFEESSLFQDLIIKIIRSDYKQYEELLDKYLLLK